MAQLIDSKMETTALAVEHEVVPLTSNRFGRPYLKDYGNVDIGPSKSSEEANKKLANQLIKGNRKSSGTTELYRRMQLRSRTHHFSSRF